MAQERATTAAAVLHALRERFDERQGWACYAEFADGTGSRKERTIDLLAVNVWPSVERVLAIEIKVSRSDFAKELADASKRRPWEWAECWFAVGPGVVSKADEIPAGWGLLVLQADGFKVVKHAEQRPLPRELPIKVWLSMARRGADPAPVLPAGSWTLPSGSVVRAADLRRLADRLHQRHTEVQRNRAAGDAQLRKLDQDRHRRLGDVIAAIEYQLRARVRNVDELRAALKAYMERHTTGQAGPSAEIARTLRALANQLDPPPPSGVYHFHQD